MESDSFVPCIRSTVEHIPMNRGAKKGQTRSDLMTAPWPDEIDGHEISRASRSSPHDRPRTFSSVTRVPAVACRDLSGSPVTTCEIQIKSTGVIQHSGTHHGKVLLDQTLTHLEELPETTLCFIIPGDDQTACCGTIQAMHETGLVKILCPIELSDQPVLDAELT